jgi:hypothetical protein
MGNLTDFFAASAGGQTLEVISGICDGSSYTVDSGTYTLADVTANQGLTTSYAAASGSSIAYTPPEGATHVEYEYGFQLSWSNDHGISHWRLYLGSDEVTQARRSLSGRYVEDFITLKWVFKIANTADTANGVVTSWDSNKTIEWRAREYGTSNGLDKLHYTTYWDGTGTAQFSKPTLKITAYKYS